ncbi:transposase [Streptomyces sp. NPDC093707]|uniref:transposase n=1 Tax=Streptomyces sp. NPDC093707 TaxID=3154984 RepID=UPI00344EE1BE
MQAEPERRDLPRLLKKAVKPHAGKEIHVVLDNLSTHTTADVKAWLAKNPYIRFQFTPVGSSWLNQIVRHESRLRERESPKEDRLMSKV